MTTEEITHLMKFYGVDTLKTLIEAQAKHIARLQMQIPSMKDEQPGKVREG